MLSDIEVFESHFGFSVPPKLIDLYSDASLANSLPTGFRFTHVGYVLEIQYLLDIRDPENYDVIHNRLSFAVNSDGFELLVDLTTENLEILQKEFDNIDEIGVTIKDLLGAERFPI